MPFLRLFNQTQRLAIFYIRFCAHQALAAVIWCPKAPYDGAESLQGWAASNCLTVISLHDPH